jgi:serine/threonine/tyrosine-interacting protein
MAEQSSYIQPTPNAPFVLRPPSPPIIHVPAGLSNGETEMRLVPTFDDVDSSNLTSQDLEIITKNQVQVATDATGTWEYECRREAQRVLDFLYLGPVSVTRNHQWLKDQEITMILVARHQSVAQARLLSVDKAAQTLGIEAEYIQMSGYWELISQFPGVVKKINDHLIAVYRQQAMDVKDMEMEEGKMVINQQNFKRGKVLVVCETGNGSSACLVAAYIMSVFGKDVVTTVQFINIQRFCCNFDEDIKRILQSWGDILAARRLVTQANSISRQPSPIPPGPQARKRGINDTIDDGDTDMDDAASDFILDRDRYVGRSQFVPYVD